MDTLSKKIKTHQRILADYVHSIANGYNNSVGNDMNYQAVVDLKGNHFQVVRIGWLGEKYLYSVLLHFDINPNTGNIWVQLNNTEIRVDVELESLGISKKHLVLGFRPPIMREMSDFAVS